MPCTREEAFRSICSMFETHWKAECTLLDLKKRNRATNALESYVPKIYWDHAENSVTKDNGEHFCRCFFRNSTTSQKSFAGARNEGVGTIYRTKEGFFVELYFAKSILGTTDQLKIEAIARSVFFAQTTGAGIWFRNPTINQLKPSDDFLKSLVSVQFQYDEKV